MFLWAGKVDNTENLYFASASAIFLLLQKFVISWLSKLNFDLRRSNIVFGISFVCMFIFPYTYSLYLIVILLNFYKLLKFTIFVGIFPIIFVVIIISSELFLLYQIFNLDQKYISQIKRISQNKTDLEVEYYEVLNENYRLEEKIASSKYSIKQKDIDNLRKKQKN